MATEISNQEEQIQTLRSKATELLLREQWQESIQVYTQIINLCEIEKTPKTPKHLCLAFSNRAESLYRLRDLTEALIDCDRALVIESNHFKTLICKGKILLDLNRYSAALACFKSAQPDPQAGSVSEMLNGYIEKCKKLDSQSRTGIFDLSDWIANGFPGNPPDLAEFIGPVQISRSEISGRGLFATKNIDSGTLLIVTKAIATERAILSGSDNEHLVMFSNFIEKITTCASKSKTTLNLINQLSSGDDEHLLDTPPMSLFTPEDQSGHNPEKTQIDKNKILSILDVNSLIEDTTSSTILGKNKTFHGVGLWIMASFINHSCLPNARRVHVGDTVMIHSSRFISAGEEITSAYFDPLAPPADRRRQSENWGFSCACKRCEFEKPIWEGEEMAEIEKGRFDGGAMVWRVEEMMRNGGVRGKEKGFLRASMWGVYGGVYGSEREMRRWGRRVPAAEAVVESVCEAVGSDERVVGVAAERWRRSDERVVGVAAERWRRSGGGGGVVEMGRVLGLGRGLYGKVVKRQALRTLLGV